MTGKITKTYKKRPPKRKSIDWSFLSMWKEEVIRVFSNKHYFIKITYDGTYLICNVSEVACYFNDCEEPEAYKLEIVKMTMRDFNNLAEFTGF